ncbi:predicted protein [Nematostella vectensis]|uniref:Uncharacterized protein n=1 Tax=Nematostella vectensis TaxID=45351 RepID=A7S1Z4_NEMVE|nr:predicted protein [Nematostella vectensis]|eukprot:XP_001634349.1 predicted protein [Nematostella vectensis]
MTEMGEDVINNTTSSGLVKCLAKNKKGYVLSPEVYEVLNKLLKSDEDNASGDIQLLCKLFSGEPASYRFSTENKRTIEANTPFCILGSTQITNAARLIARMNFGHGLIDRFLVSAPMALRPTLNEIETAKENLREEVTSDFGDVFANIKLAENEVVYTFDANGKQALRGSIERFVEEVNDAILSGRVPPKSKTPELVPRLGYHTTWAKERKQPTGDEIRGLVLMTQVPLLTYRIFKHGKRAARIIAWKRRIFVGNRRVVVGKREVVWATYCIVNLRQNKEFKKAAVLTEAVKTVRKLRGHRVASSSQRVASGSHRKASGSHRERRGASGSHRKAPGYQRVASSSHRERRVASSSQRVASGSHPKASGSHRERRGASGSHRKASGNQRVASSSHRERRVASRVNVEGNEN